MSELTLNEAKRLLDEGDAQPENDTNSGTGAEAAVTETGNATPSGTASGKKRTKKNASDKYDVLETTLIKNLKILALDEAEAAAEATIRKLKEVIRDKIVEGRVGPSLRALDLLAQCVLQDLGTARAGLD